MQSNGCSESSAASASSRRADGDDLDVSAAADELDDRLPLGLVVVDDEQPADVAVDEATRSRRRPPRRASADAASGGTPPRPASSAGCISSTPETMCTGMWRVPGCRLSRSSTVQPSRTGSVMSSTIASGRNSRASARPVSPRSATSPLKPLLPRDLELGAGEVGVVLDDQDARDRPRSIESRSSLTSLGSSSERIERVEHRLAAVVRELERSRRRRQPGRDLAQDLGAGLGPVVLDVAVGQVERERAARRRAPTRRGSRRRAGGRSRG